MSQNSRTSDTFVDRVLARANTSFVTVNQDTNANSTLSVYSSTPPLPVLVIYARDKTQCTYYHIELDFGLQIVPASCLCNTQPTRCTTSVIECRQNGSVRKFTVRKMSVSTSKLSDWDISIFSQPRHPSFDDKKVVEQIDNVKLLKFEFDSLEDRQEFTAKFNLALWKRDEAERNYQKIYKTIQWEGEKLGQSSKSAKLSKSISRSSTIASLETPFLQPLSRFSSLTISEEADKIFKMASPAPPPP